MWSNSDGYSIRELTYDDLEFFNIVRNSAASGGYLHDNSVHDLASCQTWFVKQPRQSYLLLQHDDVSIGYFRQSYDGRFMIGMDLHENYRGLGHAKPAYELYFEYLRARLDLCEVVHLEVLSTNLRAKKLYEDLGFKETNTYVINCLTNSIEMVKKL